MTVMTTTSIQIPIKAVFLAVALSYSAANPSPAEAQLEMPLTPVEGGRGLMYMQTAHTFGKGSVVVGFKGLAMKKEFLMTDPNGNTTTKMDIPTVLAVPMTFGLTDEIDLTAVMYGLHDVRGWKNTSDIGMGYSDPETGTGAVRVGMKVRLPFSDRSRIQIAGKIGALLDTSTRQADGMNYRWSRHGTDIEASLLESMAITKFMSVHFEQGYVLSGTDWFDDQIAGSAGIELRLKPWWTLSCEVANRTFLGKSPESFRRAGVDPAYYYERDGVPAAGNPDYIKDKTNDYRQDFFVVGPSMAFRLNRFMTFDIGALFNIADQARPRESYQVVAGLTFATQIKAMIDTDGDGIRNNRDVEPNTPPGFPVDEYGRALDGDMDGVPDGIDREPDTPLGARINEFGVALDSDNDGVFDGLDMEPMTPPGVPVDSFGVALDSDRDGVPDGLDKEPDTPRGAVVDKDGVALDDDGDGVPNGLDMEPDTPRGAIVDSDGVGIDTDNDGVPNGVDQEEDTPQGQLVDRSGRALVRQEFNLLREETIRLNTIHYVGGTVGVPDEASYIIDEIGAIMRKYPGLMIQIEGHTDSSGDPSVNMKLARDRARIVLEEIIRRYPDLSRERFRVVGYGSDKPIASNQTFDGRRMNRRVEFVIINRDSIRN